MSKLETMRCPTCDGDGQDHMYPLDKNARCDSCHGSGVVPAGRSLLHGPSAQLGGPMGTIKRIQCPIKNCGEIFEDVRPGEFSAYYIHYLGTHTRIPKPIKLPEMTRA